MKEAVRISFEVDPDQHKQLKSLAAIRGMTLTNLLQELIGREVGVPARQSPDKQPKKKIAAGAIGG